MSDSLHLLDPEPVVRSMHFVHVMYAHTYIHTHMHTHAHIHTHACMPPTRAHLHHCTIQVCGGAATKRRKVDRHFPLSPHAHRRTHPDALSHPHTHSTTPRDSFTGDKWGEVDTRFSYCALSTLALLGRLDAIDTDKSSPQNPGTTITTAITIITTTTSVVSPPSFPELHLPHTPHTPPPHVPTSGRLSSWAHVGTSMAVSAPCPGRHVCIAVGVGCAGVVQICMYVCVCMHV